MQAPVLVLILIYVVGPMFAGAIFHYQNPPPRAATHEKVEKAKLKRNHYKSMLRIKNLLLLAIFATRYIKKTDSLERTGILLFGTIALLYVFVGLSSAGVQTNKKIVTTLIALATILPVVFFLQKFKIIPLIKNNYTLIKWCIGVITVTGAYLIGIYTDSEIVFLTKSRADNFPHAQKALTLILTISALWATAVIIGLIAYLLQFLNIMRLFIIETTRLDVRIDKLLKSIAPREKPRSHPKRKKNINMQHEITLFVGLCFFCVLSIVIFENYAHRNTTNQDLKQIIVMTSFHADGDACGLPNDKDVSILILPMGKMIVATHLSEGDYVFEPGECKPTLYKPRQKTDIHIFNANL
ncbi:hypothetical protein [Pseudomonas viridiflava]|uniref:hypothetical protein n=1 Tax=Pseudomonas viridiflava TaxID=33069 RepID=UPI000F01AF16|nr:hypothetical protein [Pseudomonas viridiflava]